MNLNADLQDLPPPSCAAIGWGATTPAVQASEGSTGLKSDGGADWPQSADCPPDLLAYLKATRVCDAVRDLGLSERTIYRLVNGYWPTRSASARQVLRLWEDYRGRSAEPATAWMLRRIYDGGVVRHAQRTYIADLLAMRVGQLVAVARVASGGLVAQTLELPLTRLKLAEVA